MIVKDEKFRNLYGSLIILKSYKLSKRYEKLLNNHLNNDDSNNLKRDVNSLLLYPYIDHNNGMSFLVVSTAMLRGKKVKIYNRDNFDSVLTIQKQSINNSKFKYLDNLKINSDFKIYNHTNFAKKTTEIYRENEDLEDIRMTKSIDKFRNPDFPDDVLVLFLKNKLRAEKLWVRLEEFEEGFFKGILLNQPKQDFGILQGDKVNVFIRKLKNSKIECFSNFS